VQLIVSDETPAVVIIRWTHCAASAPFESAADVAARTFTRPLGVVSLGIDLTTAEV
jgi:hypothetical protein